jgi:hypothetical protein
MGNVNRTRKESQNLWHDISSKVLDLTAASKVLGERPSSDHYLGLKDMKWDATVSEARKDCLK